MCIRIALFSLLLCSLISAQDKARLDSTAVVLHSSNYACTISVPKGWIYDSAGALADAKETRIYLSKDTDKWHSIITFVAATKSVEGKNTLKNLLAWFAKGDSTGSAQITDMPALTTKDNRSVIVNRWVRTNQGKTCGSVGYVDDDQFVAVITLWANNQEDCDTYLPAFKQVIESYSSTAPAGDKSK